MTKYLPRQLATPLLAVLLCSCGEAGYYGQLVKGQYQVLSSRISIKDVLDDPARDAALKQRLKLVQEARVFATQKLRLPDNGSYTRYADLHRPFVMWNVFATPEFSLKPREWCYPLAGCLAYRGYYELARAERQVVALKAQGYEVYVGGVPAYSTLGWFDDPVLNTMLPWSDDRLVGTLFHELAHQKVFVRNDTAFNESFATFVEQEGLRRFRDARGEVEESGAEPSRQEQFVALLLATRRRLEALYASGLPVSEMRTRKQAEFEQLRADYQALRDQWGGYAGYDGWFAGELNNAKLLPFGLYHQWVPAFTALFREKNQDWTAFYAAAKSLASQGGARRQVRMQALLTETAQRREGFHPVGAASAAIALVAAEAAPTSSLRH